MPPNSRWPRPLRPGGVIGLCSPAGPSPPESIAAAVMALKTRGYRVVVAPNAAAKNEALPYLAGTDAERCHDLNALLNDDTIDLILCARGGYGSAKLLDGIDYAAARRNPKPLVGYSDITALSLALLAQTGVVSFSGIMATAGDGFGEPSLDSWSEASFWQAVGESPFPRVMASPDDAPPWQILRGGKSPISGPVIPVCLSLLTSLLGTPYVPDLRGAILVIEDVHEELYAIDRCLTQLRLSGILNDLSALLIGSFNGFAPEENARLQADVPHLAASMLPDSVAVASGVAYGHIPRRLTLPMGAEATVNLQAGMFTFDSPFAQ